MYSKIINKKLLHLNFGSFFIFDIQHNEIIWPGLAFRIARIVILLSFLFS